MSVQNQTYVTPPPCEECGRPGITVMNGRGMCGNQEHIDAVTARVFATIDQLRRTFREDHRP